MTALVTVVNEDLNILNEGSSTHPRHSTTHPHDFAHGQQKSSSHSFHPKAKTKVTVALIKSIAATKYEENFEGITYLDLCKGKYKIVDTEQQAKILLHSHITKGNLFANYPMTIPQQYYASEDQARTAGAIHEYRRRIIYQDPTGDKGLQGHLTHRCSGGSGSSSYSPYTFKDIDQLKARNFNEAIDFYHKAVVDSKKKTLPLQYEGGVRGQSAGCGTGVVRVGLHKILIHLQVYRGKEREVYYERLHDVEPDLTNNKAKTIKTIIEISGNHYLIKASAYPRTGRIIVDVPCTENPFPIWLAEKEKTTNDFLVLLANIRAFLQDRIKDPHNRIIPPTHNPCWRLKNCDINFDVPTTALNFFAYPDMQVKQFYNVAVSRIYARMINAHPYIRIEKACHNFDIAITEKIGSEIIDEAVNEDGT